MSTNYWEQQADALHAALAPHHLLDLIERDPSWDNIRSLAGKDFADMTNDNFAGIVATLSVRLRKQREDSTDAAWRAHAYPLKQITIQLQGTRHSSHDSIVQQLETVLARLRAGDTAGASHDDDFGYQFQAVESTGPSFFTEPAGAH